MITTVLLLSICNLASTLVKSAQKSIFITVHSRRILVIYVDVPVLVASGNRGKYDITLYNSRYQYNEYAAI